ncbi:unnamed protein product [Soboliphyme baturini]|uniref:CHK domain-containing protein n=1 Tax=Soboliphyme baturini TaxID=241478 RepID=A0A183IB88_9BILA|nr:unnamed protein product [Soboliphyme baturini]
MRTKSARGKKLVVVAVIYTHSLGFLIDFSHVDLYSFRIKPTEFLSPLSLQMTDDDQRIRLVLQEAVNKYYGKNLTLISADGVAVAGGKGFLSSIVRFNLVWSVNGTGLTDDDIPKTLIFKVPYLKLADVILSKASGEQTEVRKVCDANEDWITKIHNTECLIYSLFGKTPPVPVAICYMSELRTDHQAGMLVLQNLQEIGHAWEDVSQGLNLKQLHSMIDLLCRLHTWSLETDSWSANVPSYKEYLRWMTTMPPDTISELMKKLSVTLQRITGTSVDIGLVKRLTSEHFALAEEQLCDEKLPIVLVHGDLWVNNIFFDNSADGSSVVGIIDWQLAHRGTCLDDLVHLMVWNVDAELRRSHQDEILEHYFDTMSRFVSDTELPSLQQLKDAYNKTFAIQAMFFVIDFSCIVNEIVDAASKKAEKQTATIAWRLASAYEDAVQYLRGHDLLV